MNNEQSTSTLDLKYEYEKEIETSLMDSPTGLYNHGFFQISLEQEIKRSGRYAATFSLVFIDIDYFSDVNSRSSHLYGDRILKSLAQLVRDNIRDTDIAARYHGDVLSLIMLKSGNDKAVVPIERIRRDFEEMHKGEITISAGIASYPDDAVGRKGLIHKAQKALSRAKLRGKNRIQVFEDEVKSSKDSASILVVDDDEGNLKLLEALLRVQGYEVTIASSGKKALSIMKQIDVDLVLLDIMMPEMDGYEVCSILKQESSTRLIPVVMVTALDDEKSKVKGIEVGADDFISKPFSKTELLSRVKSLIQVKRLNNSLTSIENVLFSLANAVEAKDTYTQGHVERVSNFAIALAKKLNLKEKDIEAIKLAGIMHDVGKIGVPNSILNKPGPLTPEEWDIMKKHPMIGYHISQPLEHNLGKALEIIKDHHEKLDGSGYPNGKKGDDIYIGSRIMAVVDIYDALITDRSYRKGMHQDKAFEILRKEANEGKLDTEVVNTLISLVEQSPDSIESE